MRDLLLDRVRKAPPGSSIDWVTYYLRHRPLTEELVRARERGVRVRVAIEAAPRIPGANHAAIERLKGPGGLGDGFRAIAHPNVPGFSWRPVLHEKLYCFSHPAPVALIGSYNPVTDDSEGASDDLARDVLARIGDMEQGHNALVEIGDARLVAGLVAHVRALHGGSHGLLERFARAPFQSLTSGDTRVHFWPRTGAHPLLRQLRHSERGTRIRIAASHLRGTSAWRDLSRLAKAGFSVTILCDASPRRVQPTLARHLASVGIDIRPVFPVGGVPMHHKFLLVDGTVGQLSVFGSYNWTDRSRWLSHEIAVASRSPSLFTAFAEVWDGLEREARPSD